MSNKSSMFEKNHEYLVLGHYFPALVRRNVDD